MDKQIEKLVATVRRVSVEHQANSDRAGLDQQAERNNRTLAANGLTSIKDITLTNVSGTAVLQTPEIKELLEMIRRRQIGGVVVADLDRLSRTTRFEDFALFQAFQEAGASIFTSEMVLRPGSPDGYLTTLLKAGMAAMELQTIKTRMNFGKEEIRKRGGCPSGLHTLPLGISFDRVTQKYVTVSPGIDQVQEAFRLVDESGIKNYNEICRRTGIGATSLKNTLRNPSYKGERVFDKKRSAEKYASKNGRQAWTKKIPRKPDEIIRVKIFDDPPVDPARFDRVQKLLAETNHHWTEVRSHKPKVVFLALGVARCSRCGSPIYGSEHPKKNGKVDCYYKCRSNHTRFRARNGGCSFANVRRVELDLPLLHLVSDVLSRPAMVQKIVGHAVESMRLRVTNGKSPEEVAEVLKKVEAKRQRIIVAYENGALPLSDFEARISALQQEKASLQSLLSAAAAPNDTEFASTVRRIARGALAFRRIKDPFAQKKVIQELLSEVVYDATKIVSVKFRPQFSLVQDLLVKISLTAI